MSDAIRTLTAQAGDDDPLTALRAVSELRREVDRHEATLVRRARNLGYGWQMIASALQVSRQAVHKKYGPR